MPRWLKISLGIVLGVLLVLGLGAYLTYQASQSVPDFYRQAVEIDPANQVAASDKMEQRVTALASDLKKEGRWQSIFTAEQINGWLAHKLAKEFPQLQLNTIRDPRVCIRPQELVLACRYREGNMDCVVSLNTEVYLAEPNVIAVRIRGIYAGRLPLPSEHVRQQICGGVQRLNLAVDWRQADGDPVLLITLPEIREGNDKLVRVEALRLGDGEVYLAGTTTRRK